MISKNLNLQLSNRIFIILINRIFNLKVNNKILKIHQIVSEKK